MTQRDPSTDAVASLTKRATFYFRVALICGAAPIVVGYAILFAYWLTRHDWLFLAGMITVPCGLLTFIWGMFAIIRCRFAEQRLADAARTTPRQHRVLLALLLLLANVPAAWFGVGTAFSVGNFWYLDVINQSGAVIDNCTISVGDDRTLTSGSIPAGGRYRAVTIWNVRGDPLNLDIQQGANRVTSNFRWSAAWTRFYVKPGLVIKVEDSD